MAAVSNLYDFYFFCATQNKILKALLAMHKITTRTRLPSLYGQNINKNILNSLQQKNESQIGLKQLESDRILTEFTFLCELL